MLQKTLSLTFLVAVPLAAQSQAERWEWSHMGGSGMFLGWAMWYWLIVLAVIVVVIAKYTSGTLEKRIVIRSDRTALTALKTRFANGEIDQKEYLAIKQTLES